MSQKKYNRRSLFKATGAGALLTALPGTSLQNQSAFAQAAGEKKFIFVIAATGGASIIDSFLAQATGPAAFANLETVNGSAFSAVPALENSIQSYPSG